MVVKKRSYHTLRDFFLVVFKHKPVIVIFFLLAFIFAAAACFIMPPVYEASSKLVVKNSGKDAAGEGSASLQKASETETTIDTAVEILTGRYLIEKVITGFGAKKLYPGISGKGFFDQVPEVDRAMIRFKENLTVTRGAIIEVKFRHRDPALAAQVVNKLIEQFLDHYLSVQKQNQKYGFFKDQLALMNARLQESQKALGLFRNEQNISSIQKQKSLLLLQISDMEVDLGRTRAEMSEQESLAESAKKGSGALADFQQKLNALQSKEKKLNQQITQYRLDLGRLDKAETQLSELERQVRMDEENYLLYAKKTEEARINSAMDEQKIINFSVIEPALPPFSPIKPDKLFILFAALVLGCIGGTLLAFAAEYFTHAFDNAGDVEEILSSQMLGAFPELTRQQSHMLKALTLPEAIAGECDRIKYYLTRVLGDTKGKALLFSSAKKRDGASTVASAFAVALAAHGEKVLLIDANLSAPALHALFQVEQAEGLSDILIKKATLESSIKNTRLENLRLITSGTPQPNSSLLLHYEQYDSFMREARTKADWVLIDAPPVTTHNEAGIIAARTDGVLLVVKAGRTRWEVAYSAFAQFRKHNAKMQGVILNRHRMYIPEWLYKML